MINRQARLAGSNEWQDFGDVTLEDAAIAIARKANRVDDKVQVFVRDQERPDEVWPLTVETCISYKVSGLRGGDV
jgi:hypothetical protein